MTKVYVVLKRVEGQDFTSVDSVWTTWDAALTRRTYIAHRHMGDGIKYRIDEAGLDSLSTLEV